MIDTAPSDKSGKRLGIVVPMYNEIVGAETCVRRLLDLVPSLEISSQLIVVDDGSSDGTGALLDGLAREFPSLTVVHQANAGYGGALIHGAQEAAALGCDYVLFMDSDLTNPPEHVARFVPAIRRGVDLVKGNRFGSGGDMLGVPWRRRIYSILGNIVARACFRMGLADCTNGFRAIRTSLFLSMPLQERGFPIILEELYWAKRLGAVAKSVPTSLVQRAADQRESAFTYQPAVLWRYLKFALLAGLRW